MVLVHTNQFSDKTNLLNVFIVRLSASVTQTKLVVKHISTLHAAHKVFITAESSDKLQMLHANKHRIHVNFMK